MVKINPVAGGDEVEVAVEKGNEAYDPAEGKLFEVRRATPKDLHKAIDDAVKAGKKIKSSEG